MIETTKAWAHRAAQAFAFVVAFHPQVSWAEGFSGKEFAQWETASQDNYIQTSVTMIGIVASEANSPIMGCVDEWYFTSETVKDERNQRIRAIITEYMDFHPSAVILAVVQDACGKFANR
ncbi:MULTISPECIES: hypothetical protein [Paracoccaceae]|uniref:hypothetical protein n=1 Tax=Paracoccaceae TaxID=31989 RepID=UPI00329A22AF